MFESGGKIEGEGIEEVYVLKPGESIVFDGDFENVIVQAKVKIEVTDDTTIGNLEVTDEASDSEIIINEKATVKQMTINAPHQGFRAR